MPTVNEWIHAENMGTRATGAVRRFVTDPGDRAALDRVDHLLAEARHAAVAYAETRQRLHDSKITPDQAQEMLAEISRRFSALIAVPPTFTPIR